jgi:hypothetical protein
MRSGYVSAASPLGAERGGGGGSWSGALRAFAAAAPGTGGWRERAWLAARAARATLLQYAPAAEELEQRAEGMAGGHGATHGIEALQAQRELLALVPALKRQKLEQALGDAAALATSSLQLKSSWAALQLQSEPDGAAGQGQAQTPQQVPRAELLEHDSPAQASTTRRRLVDEWAHVMVGGIPLQLGEADVIVGGIARQLGKAQVMVGGIGIPLQLDASVNVQDELEAVGSAPALLRLCSQDPLEAVGSEAELPRLDSPKRLDRSLERACPNSVYKSLKRNLSKLKRDEQELEQAIWIVRESTRFAPAPNVEPLRKEMHEMLSLSASKSRDGSAVTECCAAIAIKRLYLMAMVEGCVSVLGSELKSILEDAESGLSEKNFKRKAQFLQEQDRLSASLVRELENALTASVTDNSMVTAKAAARIAARLDVSSDDVEFCLARLIKAGRVRQGQGARS